MSIQNAVPKFGNDTEGLLDFVYKTEPMHRAAPGEKLNFSNLRQPQHPVEDDQDISRPLSQGQLKRRNKIIAALKEELKNRLIKIRMRILKLYQRTNCTVLLNERLNWQEVAEMFNTSETNLGKTALY